MQKSPFSKNGKEPETQPLRGDISKGFMESLKYFIEGNLIINPIEDKTEITETEERIILNLRFKGGGEKVYNFIQEFYEEKKEIFENNPYVKGFRIKLDGDKKEFVLEVELRHSLELSTKEKEEVNKLLNQVREVLDEFQKRLREATTHKENQDQN